MNGLFSHSQGLDTELQVADGLVTLATAASNTVMYLYTVYLRHPENQQRCLFSVLYCFSNLSQLKDAVTVTDQTEQSSHWVVCTDFIYIILQIADKYLGVKNIQ